MPFKADYYAVRGTVPGTGRYKLLESITYIGKHETFTVPAGFTTDFTSVPRVFTWLYARDDIYTPVAILHDYLCREAGKGRFSRRDADGIFRRVLRESGVDPVSRWCMWAAVRLGGFMKDGTSAKEVAQISGIMLVALPLVTIPVVAVAAVWAVFKVAGVVASNIEELANND